MRAEPIRLPLTSASNKFEANPLTTPAPCPETVDQGEDFLLSTQVDF